MKFSRLIGQLTERLRILPSVGPKSAQRMALHILERDREGALALASAIVEACENVGHCSQCRNFTEQTICDICARDRRNSQLVCVVESPADVVAIEQSASFDGIYFVLMGRLSPIEGITAQDIGLPLLETRLASGDISEVILATNPTVEGEATAHYIADRASKHGVDVTRIAHGVPLGGELEYIDSGTLMHAFSGRRKVGTP